jgi:hypothetical protein
MSIDYITGRKRSDLYGVFLKHKPSKQAHNYLPAYARHFEPVRHDVRKVLEIGVEAGTSLRMWADYFPRAEIYGMDLNPRCKELETDRIRIVIGDQSNPADLAQLPTDLDIIIDDGSHVPDHQINTFKHLFRHHMPERGIYAIEDCEGRLQTIAWFKELAMHVNYWPKGLHPGKWPSLNSFPPAPDNGLAEYLTRNVIGVSIYRYLVMVDKGRNPEDGEAAFRLNDDAIIQEMWGVRNQFLEPNSRHSR